MADAVGITNGQTAQESDFTGIIWPYAGAGVPAGFLLCDGSAVSRTTYSRLFGVIGSTYGAGDGSTTFNVPDGRGRLFVGAGTGTKKATISSVASSIITATGLTNAANNEFQTGQAIVFTATVAGNLVNATTYFVIRQTNTTFKVASSLLNAQNGTAITLAGTETGFFTLTLAARSVGDTGGEENHAMSATELLAHTHGQIAANSGGAGQQPANIASGSPAAALYTTGSTGGNTAMNVMQPFLVGNWIIKT